MKKTVSFSPDASNVFFHILTACNLKCRHCYINPKEHGTESLALSTIESWLAIFAGQSKKANIIFLGGEPTLHPDLPKAVKTARNEGYSSITIDTNGFLFNDILSKLTPGDVDFFSFSLDGATRHINDMIRGGGVYDKCIESVKKAVSEGYSTSLIYTVSGNNLHELHLMGPLLENLGINRFFIQVIGLRGKSSKAGKKNLQVSKSEWTDIVPKAAEEISKRGITVTYPKVYLEKNEKFECAAIVAKNYFIFPNGRVYRCPLCEDFPIHSMEIRDNRLHRHILLP